LLENTLNDALTPARQFDEKCSYRNKLLALPG
jgi:hypothetical protein